MILPEDLLEHFSVSKVETAQETVTIHLREENNPPETADKVKLESKGFHSPITIKDFPLRGKACYLRVHRRRWTHPLTGQTISRNWQSVAKGTRMTQEFAAFLKEVARYQSGKL